MAQRREGGGCAGRPRVVGPTVLMPSLHTTGVWRGGRGISTGQYSHYYNLLPENFFNVGMRISSLFLQLENVNVQERVVIYKSFVNCSP